MNFIRFCWGLYFVKQIDFMLLHAFLWNFFIITIETAELRHLRFSMVEQFQSRLARIKSERFLFTWPGCFFSFKLFTTDSQEKYHTYLTDSQYSTFVLNKYSLSCSICHRVDNYELVKRLGFFCLLIFPVSSPPSTNTLRFPHSSWMNSILSKSSKFPVSSTSIPSSSSLTITFFLKGCAIQLKRDCLWK